MTERIPLYGVRASGGRLTVSWIEAVMYGIFAVIWTGVCFVFAVAQASGPEREFGGLFLLIPVAVVSALFAAAKIRELLRAYGTAPLGRLNADALTGEFGVVAAGFWRSSRATPLDASRGVVVEYRTFGPRGARASMYRISQEDVVQALAVPRRLSAESLASITAVVEGAGGRIEFSEATGFPPRAKRG